jgi:hypothetical protein
MNNDGVVEETPPSSLSRIAPLALGAATLAGVAATLSALS